MTKLGDSELHRQLSQLEELATETRGRFLEQAIDIEQLISDIIATHFCPEEKRRSLFFSLVINQTGLTFASKIKVFDRLLRLCYPELLRKYPKLKDELDSINKFRNRIAHAMLDTSEAFLNHKFKDRIRLLYHSDGQQKHLDITVSDIRDRLTRCTTVVLALVEI